MGSIQDNEKILQTKKDHPQNGWRAVQDGQKIEIKEDGTVTIYEKMINK